MQSRGLLIATVLLAVLAGGVWWSNKHQPSADAKSKTDSASSPKILTVPDDQISQLSLKRKDGVETVLKKNAANKWEMVAPSKFRVDNDAASSLTSALNPLTADQVVEEKPSSLDSFGLNSPSLEVTVTKKMASPTSS